MLGRVNAISSYLLLLLLLLLILLLHLLRLRLLLLFATASMCALCSAHYTGPHNRDHHYTPNGYSLRTRTARVRAQCSLPDPNRHGWGPVFATDPNRDRQRPVFATGPEPRSLAACVRYRPRTAILGGQCSLPARPQTVIVGGLCSLYWTATANSGVQCSPPDPNCDGFASSVRYIWISDR